MINCKNVFETALFASLVLLTLAAPFDAAYAFRFSPIYATLTPEGKSKTASFTLENTNDPRRPG